MQDIQLSPIIESNPVSFTMDTIGWKILFLILIATALVIAYKYYLNYKHDQYRRDAVLRITEITQHHKNSIKDIIVQIMFQIKQTALQTYNRKRVASLEGTDWFEFLDEKVKGSCFLENNDTITNAVYKNEFENISTFNQNEFVSMSIKWIKNHA